MFNKLLIANRGEIACRVIKTARRLGIRTAAVYSDADAESAHVALADEAYWIGPPTPRESYLSIEALVGAARLARADAVHPGYGFLSENADFAEACLAAGMTFIGPPAHAIRAMGSKSEAKRIMLDAQVPLIPGYHDEDQTPARLRAEANAIGYPVLLKASAGGGGRGMRVVSASGEFDAALEGAKREAKGAFGDDRMLIERYITEPRHVEIQVFGDLHGNMVHLFERDCSAQRRHQKIVEEAPAPGIDEELRARMCDAAIAASRAIGYVGAGTVELLLDRSGHFYFMEMNTRLQVEHPVTELITGEDLVEWQILVAAGEPLPRHQDQIRMHGHAVEARLYAEDPARKFMPSTGRLEHLRFPDRDPLVRIDSGVRPGDEISFYYDPMIAKVIAWGDTRTRAAERLAEALRETEVVGVTTNAGFLGRLVSHPKFVRGGIDTGFVAEHGHELLGTDPGVDDAALGTAALAVMVERREAAGEWAKVTEDRHSPWNVASDWRLNGDAVSTLSFQAGGETHQVRVRTTSGSGYAIELPSGATLPGDAERRGPGRLRTTLGPVRREVSVVRRGADLVLLFDGRRFELAHLDPDAIAAEDEVVPGSLSAPMPGRVIAINVEAGQPVRRGTTVIVLEAMKMEHNIVAPSDGTVAEVRYRVGDLVEEGAELIVVDTAE